MIFELLGIEFVCKELNEVPDSAHDFEFKSFLAQNNNFEMNFMRHCQKKSNFSKFKLIPSMKRSIGSQQVKRDTW